MSPTIDDLRNREIENLKQKARCAAVDRWPDKDLDFDGMFEKTLEHINKMKRPQQLWALIAELRGSTKEGGE